eukprot:1192272-Prorocentrum_minimum.AAC.3
MNNVHKFPNDTTESTEVVSRGAEQVSASGCTGCGNPTETIGSAVIAGTTAACSSLQESTCFNCKRKQFEGKFQMEAKGPQPKTRQPEPAQSQRRMEAEGVGGSAFRSSAPKQVRMPHARANLYLHPHDIYLRNCYLAW